MSTTTSTTTDHGRELLSDLAAAGIRVELLDGGRLKATPRAAITPELRDRLKTHLGAVLAILRPPVPEADPPGDRRLAKPETLPPPRELTAYSLADVEAVVAELDERIGIRHHDGGLPPADAEAAGVADLIAAGVLWRPESWAAELHRRSAIIDDPALAWRFRRAAAVLANRVDHNPTT